MFCNGRRGYYGDDALKHLIVQPDSKMTRWYASRGAKVGDTLDYLHVAVHIDEEDNEDKR